MTLIAKPIVKNQLWIVVGDQGKVGNVIADKGGFTLVVGNSEKHFDTADDMEKMLKIEFDRSRRKSRRATFSEFPTDSKTYNDVMDLRRKIHIYTKTPKSKCYYAAGWYRIKLQDTWETVFCPKYIFVQRYDYTGPYMSKEAADLA